MYKSPVDLEGTLDPERERELDLDGELGRENLVSSSLPRRGQVFADVLWAPTLPPIQLCKDILHSESDTYSVTFN